MLQKLAPQDQCTEQYRNENPPLTLSADSLHRTQHAKLISIHFSINAGFLQANC